MQSESEPLPRRSAMQRAAAWYRRGLAGAPAEAKSQLESRIAEFDRAHPVVPHGEWLDALGMVDLSRDVLQPSWSRSSDGLDADGRRQLARCAVPITPAGASGRRSGVPSGCFTP